MTKDYAAFKYKVQRLVKVGELKFEKWKWSIGVKNLYRAKIEVIRQEKVAPRGKFREYDDANGGGIHL